jgi:hypothetical protein
MCGARLLFGQREVHVNLAEKKIRAGVAVDQIGVLADPAQAGVAGQGLLQYRRAVREDTVAEGPHRVLYAVAELLQARAHELVIIAAQGVARYIAQARVGEGGPGIGGFLGPVIHAYADAAHGSRE